MKLADMLLNIYVVRKKRNANFQFRNKFIQKTINLQFICFFKISNEDMI